MRTLSGLQPQPLRTKALHLGNGAEIRNPLATWTLQPERLDAVTPLMKRITVAVSIRSTQSQRDLVVDLERLSSSYLLMTETAHAAMGSENPTAAG